MSNPIENIKEQNRPIIKNMESSSINIDYYNGYLNQLDALSSVLNEDITNKDLNESINNLIDDIKKSDIELDGKINSLINQLTNASINEIPIIKENLQNIINTQKDSINTIQKKYKSDKEWVKQTTHESIVHEKNILSLDSKGLSEYQNELKSEIETLYDDIFKISNELQKSDANFGKNFFPEFINSEEYMKNKNDIENALEMTHKAIQETINYVKSASVSDDLKIQLPGVEGEEGTLTFKTKADKLFYCKIFLETLKEGLKENNSNWGVGISILIGLGIVTIVGGKLVFKIPLLKIGAKSINGALWGLGKMPLIKSITNKIPKIKTESGASNSEPKTNIHAKVETKGEFMTRERAFEIVRLFEKKYIDTAVDDDYRKLSFEIEKLETFINKGGFDNAKEIQLGEVLNYLNDVKEFPQNFRGKVGEKIKTVSKSSKTWNEKNTLDTTKEGTGNLINKIIPGTEKLKVPKIEEIEDIKAIKKFLDDLGKSEEKITVNFGGENIEVDGKLEKLLSDIESREAEFKVIEKAEGIKSLYDKSIITKGYLETQLSTLNDLITNTAKDGSITQSPNPAYTTVTKQLDTINTKIDKLETNFVDLNVGDINIFDANTEKTRLGGIIDAKINEIKTNQPLTSGVGKIELELKSTRISKIKGDLVMVLKRIKI